MRLNDYNLDNTIQGVIFAIQPLFYTFATFLTPYIVPAWMERRVALILNLILLGVSIAFIGPFYTDQNLTVMCIALVVSGFLLGPIMIMPMQEMMESTRTTYPQCDFEHATNLLSGILTSSIGLGQAIGPLIGSSVYSIVGFRATQDVTALVVISSGVLYLIFGKGF